MSASKTDSTEGNADNTTQQKINELENQITELENDEVQIKKQMDTYFKAAETDKYRIAFNESSRIAQEKISLQSQITKLEYTMESEKGKLNGKSTENGMTKKFTGTTIIMFSVIIGIAILAIANRRSISSFAVQSTMPIAKEGIEEMAPSIGKVAKEIGKGFKDEQ